MPQPGEDPRRLAHVVLAVAGVDADGVQLEQLAAVVLVDAGDDAAALVHVGAVRVVVEEEQHRRVRGHGAQQVAEAAEHEGTDRLPLVRHDAVARRTRPRCRR